MKEKRDKVVFLNSISKKKKKIEKHEFFASICVPSKMTQRLNRHLVRPVRENSRDR